MRMRTLVPIAVASIAIAAVAGIATGRAIWPQPAVTMPAMAPLPPLYVAEEKRDLGEVWETSDAVLTVPISNSTDKPIEILDFETSCDCGEISPRRLTVPANGTANVSVKMDLTRRAPHQLGMVHRKYSIEIWPIVFGTEKQTVMTINWIARSAVTFNHANIHFGELDAESQQPNYRTLAVTAHVPIVHFVAQCDSASFAICVADSGYGKWSVRVRPVGDGKAGYCESTLKMSWKLATGQKQSAVARVSCTMARGKVSP